MSLQQLESADALGGPDWLREFRNQAAALAADRTAPTAEVEEWRYSPIADLKLERFQLAPSPGASTIAPLDGVSEWSARIQVVDGHVVSAEVTEPSGLTVASAVDLDAETAALGVSSDAGDAYFVGLTDALSANPVVVRVDRGANISAPVLIQHHVSTADTLTLPRVTVHVGDGARVDVVESHTSEEVSCAVVPLIEMAVAGGAVASYTLVQQLGADAVSLGSQRFTVGGQATLNAAVVALGGSYTRARIDCSLDGRGATGNLRSLYFGDRDQVLDFRTFQDHRAPDTTSDLLFKGVLAEKAGSIYTGLIRVDEGARGTNAFQTNRNLKMSPDAWAWSVPNLEIENNEVHCSHASTVSPVDEDQRFYLESRGVTPEDAELLLVRGFFDEVFAKLPRQSLADPLRGAVVAKLAGVER